MLSEAKHLGPMDERFTGPKMLRLRAQHDTGRARRSNLGK
jgi:hypothetical protein